MHTDKNKKGLRGSVHTVREETAQFIREDSNLIEQPWLIETDTFDEQGRLLETTFHNSQHPEYSSKEVFSYDTAGKLIEQSFSHLNGRSAGKSVFSYDSDLRLVEISSYSSDGRHTGKRVFVYRANGTKAEESFFDYQEHEANTDYGYGVDANPEYDHSFTANGARLIKTLHDLQGNPKELQFLTENGKLLNKVLFTTDHAGRITKDEQYAGEEFRVDIPEGTEIALEAANLLGGATALCRSELVYDEEGRKIEDRMYFGSSLLTRRVFVYGDRGELIEEATYGGTGTLQSKARIEHEYDSHGNWTKRQASSWIQEKSDFEPSVVYRRTITYYGQHAA